MGLNITFKSLPLFYFPGFGWPLFFCVQVDQMKCWRNRQTHTHVLASVYRVTRQLKTTFIVIAQEAKKATKTKWIQNFKTPCIILIHVDDTSNLN